VKRFLDRIKRKPSSGAQGEDTGFFSSVYQEPADSPQVLTAWKDRAVQIGAKPFDRKSGAAYDGLARIWRDSRRPDLALSEATRAVHFAPRSPEIMNTLGTVLLALGNIPEARKVFATTLALDPTAAYARQNAALAARLTWTPEPQHGPHPPGHEP